MEPYDIAESVQPTTAGDTLPALPPEMHTDDQSVTSDSGGHSCRICRGDATDEQPLFHPCKCSGSIRYVHQECLIEWLSHSKKKYCELCKTPFRFTKIYDQSMPATLPWPLFAHQLGVHVLSTACRWARYVLVAAVWLIALPWCIRQVWRGLFWLADGSWLPDAQRRIRTANEAGAVQNATAAGSDLGEGDVGNSITAAFSSFMRFLAGESVAAKLFRILFSVPPVILGPGGGEQESRRPRSALFHRPASLLSDVSFIQNATSPGLARNIFTDVLEGLLICLGLVSGFVLVFLIREWVINQQPTVNEGDGQAARQPDAADDARRQRAIRRHRPRRAARDANPDATGDIQPVADPARVVRRRALTDDNIGAPATQNPGRPDLPARAQSLVIPPFRPSATNTEGHIDASATIDGDLPPPLLRGMVGEAVDARRALEEAVSNATSDYASSTAAQTSSPALLEARSDAMVRDDNVLTSDNTQLPIASSEHEVADASTTNLRDETSIIDSEMTVLDFGDRLTTSHASDSAAPLLTPTSDESLTADTAGDDSAAAVPASSEPIVAPLDDDAADIHQPAPQIWLAFMLGKLEHFFWFVDGVPDPSLHQDLPNRDEPEDPAEAPFVPAQNRGVALLPEDLVLPPPVPVEAGAAPQPFDVNDPDALEDAEDLEGIMELVGMEGPLIGMVQNVVFSLLLISLTLAVAVWIPYIWGKIALILLANPVAVLFKTPLYIITSCVDLVADICFFVLGLLGIFFNVITKTVKATTEPILPAYARLLDTETFEQMAVNVTHQSGSRLEKTLREAIIIFSPDLPTFSMQSHRALLTFKASFSSAASALFDLVGNSYTSITTTPWSVRASMSRISVFSLQIHALPGIAIEFFRDTARSLRAALRPQLQPMTLDTSSAQDLALVEWSTQDKIIAIVIGYIFFAFAGMMFMKFAHVFLGLKRNEKVEGQVADRLREAGGVLKVIVIIGIEMIVFPLYCGLLFDIAMLPLFEGATLASRLAFIARAPFTGLFLHWFAGTCYMFHFALFVSMCRKILRKGVLYFIRDPDDPTFHPVRDVLERPVPTQLGKIAFSALVYGGLVIICLGGVVWSVASVSSILPIRWTTSEPRLAFPLDVVFYNLGVPFLLRKTKPSEKIAAVYEWWFRGTARSLRLSHFLFNEDRKDEKRPARTKSLFSWRRHAAKEDARLQEGTYVRAPASDSCRIPKNNKTFLEVTSDNKRIGGGPDERHGLHGRKNALFGFFWLPPHFRARIATFVVLLWMFAAGTGIACTIGPLIVGRKVIQVMSGSEEHVNDLYALTIGVHLLAVITFLCFHVRSAYHWTTDQLKSSVARPSEAFFQLWKAAKYTAGMLYLGVAFGIVFPFLLSFITELYIHVPIFAWYIDRERFIAAVPGGSDATILSAATTLVDSASLGLTSKAVPPVPPTVFILQTWTLGLLYLRIALRIAVSYPCRHTRIATAITMIINDGVWRPNVWLATRAVVLPLGLLCTVVLFLPLAMGQLSLKLGILSAPEDVTVYYRLAYPVTMSLASGVYWAWQAKIRLALWRSLVRDEVYLVGERLHNYAVHTRPEDKDKRNEKGKGNAIMQATAADVGSQGEVTGIEGMDTASGEIAEEATPLAETTLLSDW